MTSGVLIKQRKLIHITEFIFNSGGYQKKVNDFSIFIYINILDMSFQKAFKQTLFFKTFFFGIEGLYFINNFFLLYIKVYISPFYRKAQKNVYNKS